MAKNLKDSTVDAESAVSAVIDSFRAAGKAGDLDAFMGQFADDAVWMLADRLQDASKNDAREYFSFLEDHAFDQQVSKDEIRVLGDWAFARVTFDGYLNPKPGVEGESSRVVSRHFMVLKQQKDGTWKLVRDIWIKPR